MASFFSVIRYVPSAVTNEAINVGVLIASGNSVAVRTLDDWTRVKFFAGRHWKDVRRIVTDMQGDPSAFLGIDTVDSAEDLRRTLCQWTRVLQFSDVRASVAPVAELMNTIPTMILGEATEDLSAAGRRSAVLKTLYQSVVSAYELRFGRRPQGMVQKQVKVAGNITNHKVDVGLANGEFYGGAFALSFASAQTEKQWKDTDAVAFAVNDMRAPTERLAVVLDPPIEADSEPYDRAQDVFEQLGVRMLGVAGISEWAGQAVTAIPDSAAHL